MAAIVNYLYSFISPQEDKLSLEASRNALQAKVKENAAIIDKMKEAIFSISQSSCTLQTSSEHLQSRLSNVTCASSDPEKIAAHKACSLDEAIQSVEELFHLVEHLSLAEAIANVSLEFSQLQKSIESMDISLQEKQKALLHLTLQKERLEEMLVAKLSGTPAIESL